MSRFLEYLDQIRFKCCIVRILPNFRAILSLCMEIYQWIKFMTLRRGTPLQDIKVHHHHIHYMEMAYSGN